MPAPHLLIRLRPDGAAEWLALGRDGRVLAGPQAGLPAERGERIDVIVPSDTVLLLRAPRVAKQRHQLEQALPFAIEEQLAAPVESLQVAIADSDGGDTLVAAVVSHARLDAWLAPLRAAGLEPDRVVPESWLLPWAADVASVYVEGDDARNGGEPRLCGTEHLQRPRRRTEWRALRMGNGESVAETDRGNRACSDERRGDEADRSSFGHDACLPLQPVPNDPVITM